MSENALNILSEETFIEQTEQIIELLKGKHLEPLPIKPDDTGKIVWINLDDGMYIIDSTGVIEDGADGITMNKNDVLFKNGNDAYLYTASFAGKLTYNHETGSYKSYLFSITAEQLEELIEEIHGGGAPVEHTHPVSDIYIEQIYGGAWDTDFYKLQNVELVEAVKNDEEIMAYIEEEQTTPEEFIEHYLQLFDGSMLTDSNGNSYISFVMMISKALLKSKIAPNSSFNDLDFGAVAKIPTTFDGEDMSQISLSRSDKNIICGVSEHEYQPVAVTDINDLFGLLSEGYPDPDNQEEVDAWLQKYGSKTIAVSLHPTDENGEDIDYTFSDIMTLAFNYIGFVAPVSDLEELMNAENEEEGMSAIKFHFDAVEEETITKLPLSEDIAKKITALTDRDSQLEEKINQVKNMDIDLNRIVKKETIYYGGEHSDMVYAFNSNSYANNLYSTEQTAQELNDKMTGGHEDYQDRMKMGSVFELTYDEETSEPVYTYLGTASEQNGLIYTVEFNGNTGAEKSLTSLNDFLDENGYFGFNEENISAYLLSGEYTFVTIINNGSVERVYGAFNGENAYIRIDEVVPWTERTETQSLSNIINILQNGVDSARNDASSAESIAANAQAIAETASSTANGAQSTAESAQSTAESAQSTAESAQSTAENIPIKRVRRVLTASDAERIVSLREFPRAGNMFRPLNSSGTEMTGSGEWLSGGAVGKKIIFSGEWGNGVNINGETIEAIKLGTFLNAPLNTATSFERGDDNLKLEIFSYAGIGGAHPYDSFNYLQGKTPENIINGFIPQSISDLQDFVNNVPNNLTSPQFTVFSWENNGKIAYKIVLYLPNGQSDMYLLAFSYPNTNFENLDPYLYDYMYINDRLFISDDYGMNNKNIAK